MFWEHERKTKDGQNEWMRKKRQLQGGRYECNLCKHWTPHRQQREAIQKSPTSRNRIKGDVKFPAYLNGFVNAKLEKTRNGTLLCT